MILLNLVSQPLPTVLKFLQMVIQDLVNALAGTWYRTIDPAKINLSSMAVLFAWGAAVLCGGLVTVIYYYFNKNDYETKPISSFSEDKPNVRRISPSLIRIMLFGLVAFILGMLPVWALGKQIFQGMYGGRYGLAGMLGASIMCIAILEWLTPRLSARAIILGSLIALSISYHLSTGGLYYRVWQNQLQFYWQLTWRAPHIQGPAAILSGDEILSFMGRDSTSAAINVLYDQPQGKANLNYWFFELYHDIGEERAARLERGIPLKDRLRSLNFETNSENSLIFYYKPGVGRCLWVLSPEDIDIPNLPEIVRLALPTANLELIQKQSSPGYPPPSIFGGEPDHNWCYYYEKAELARQNSDWQQVYELGKQAVKKDLTPKDTIEWLPFIEARLRLGMVEDARQQTLEIYKTRPDLGGRLCRSWSGTSKDLPEVKATYSNLQITMNCNKN